MGTIFRKTAKGGTEIETRAHRLPPRMRSTLILVDGRRSDDDLRQMIVQQCDETLRALLDQGFIEAIGTSAATRSVPAENPGVAPRKPADTQPTAADFTTLRRDAVRQFTDQVGPMAESLAIRMERAKDMTELAPLIETASQLIGNVRGAAAAATYGAKFRPG